MGYYDDIVNKSQQKRQTNAKTARDRVAINTYGPATQGSGVNSSYTATYRPDILAKTMEARNAGYTDATYGGALDYYLSPGGPGGGAPQAVAPKRTGATSTVKSGGRSYGGGGGGGGGGNAAALAQSQLDAMLQMLGSQTWKAPPMTDVRNQIAGRSANIDTALQNDIGTANTAWNNYDAYLAANNRNPYGDVRLQQARVAQDQNPYLASQGVSANDVVRQNPDDSYGGFQNVLQLLSAATNQSNQSMATGSQQGRVSTLNNINALDNPYRDAIQQQLAQVSQQEYTAQQALDQQRREAYMAIMPLLAQGAKAPADVMQQMGWA